MSNDRCENCRWWGEITAQVPIYPMEPGRGFRNQVLAVCRRFPKIEPKEADDFCGEHTPLPEEQPKMVPVAAIRDAWLAGFAASAEGWNGEHPRDDSVRVWREAEASKYAAMLSASPAVE